ncbi:hypothetical protein C9J85_17030 [Haloferax sp. wsp5]|nr:hypothetical protein C9J85_17030 [Haloferax sp. wsp5]
MVLIVFPIITAAAEVSIILTTVPIIGIDGIGRRYGDLLGRFGRRSRRAERSSASSIDGR